MPLPDSLRIGAHEYAVRLRDDLRDAQTDSRIWGHYDPARLEVAVLAELPPTRRLASLLHEVVHAVADMMAVEVSERDVDCLAEGLAQVLVANGLLRRSLLRP